MPATVSRVRRRLLLGLAALSATAGTAHGAERPRILVDQLGHEVRLPATVRRVGTPGVAMASLLMVLSQRRKLTAIAPEAAANPWLRRMWPEVAGLPTPFSRLGGVNLEELQLHRPDLVTLWIGHHQMDNRIEATGIPVLHLGYATPGELHAAMRLLGSALGPREAARAEDYLGYYDANLQRVAASLQGLPDAGRPRVYYASSTALHTEGRDSMIDAWITAAAGRNVAREALQGYGQVNLESILAWDPQIIIALGRRQRDEILTDPRWKTVTAVRAGRVHTSPRGISAWCTRAVETALQLLWAAQTFHPDRFAGLDMPRETRDFYRRFYDFEPDDDDVRRILRGEDPRSS